MFETRICRYPVAVSSFPLWHERCKPGQDIIAEPQSSYPRFREAPNVVRKEERCVSRRRLNHSIPRSLRHTPNPARHEDQGWQETGPERYVKALPSIVAFPSGRQSDPLTLGGGDVDTDFDSRRPSRDFLLYKDVPARGRHIRFASPSRDLRTIPSTGQMTNTYSENTDDHHASLGNCIPLTYNPPVTTKPPDPDVSFRQSSRKIHRVPHNSLPAGRLRPSHIPPQRATDFQKKKAGSPLFSERRSSKRGDCM